MNKVITGIITDAFGIVIWIFSLVLIYQGKIEVLWEGIGLMGFGSIFFFLGESTITALLKKFLNGIINLKTKQNGTDDQSKLQ